MRLKRTQFRSTQQISTEARAPFQPSALLPHPPTHRPNRILTHRDIFRASLLPPTRWHLSYTCPNAPHPTPRGQMLGSGTYAQRDGTAKLRRLHILRRVADMQVRDYVAVGV